MSAFAYKGACRVLLLGHSNVISVRDHIYTSGIINFGLPPSYHVWAVGMDGASLEDMDQFLPTILQYKPHIILLDIGACDIIGWSTNPETVAAAFFTWAMHFCKAPPASCRPNIIFLEQHYRSNVYPSTLPPQNYNDLLFHLNYQISLLADPLEGIHYWHLSGLNGTAWASELADGLRLNGPALQHYLRNIQTAVLSYNY